MTAASTGPLVDALRRYRLLEPARLEEAARLQPGFSEPKALADDLVRRGWLTPYQADRLLNGRGQDLVLGGYVLLEPLGEGGMGQVFKARQAKLGRVVALKVVRKERLRNPDVVRRFRREVRALAALSHPNIVTAYSAEEIDGSHLLAMEYLDGATDLAALVKKNGPLPYAEACEYVRQAALGLQHAHERGMVHRDVKPHNLMLCPGGAVKVLDLGLARLDAAAGVEISGALTQDGAVFGSPDYLSPEQARDMRAVDIRSDIYSLGCTLYHLLAGRPPYPGGAFFDKVLRHRLREPEPLDTLRPDLPPAVVALVRKMMAKRPEDRFGTPAEVADAVTAALRGGPADDPGGLTTPAPPGGSDAEPTPSEPPGVTAAPPRWRGAPPVRWPVYAGLTLLTLLVGAGLAALLYQRLRNIRTYDISDPHHPEIVVTPSVGTTTPPVPHPPPSPALPPPPEKLPTEVFEDFESGTYGKWKATGTAFGDRPATGALPGQQRVTGFGGKRLVNTFYGGDKSVGTLTSPEFTIRHSYIRFRIGGGDRPRKECINLRVDGKVARTGTGKSMERLDWDSWDVTDFKGKKAVIEIIDDATGPWGHINIDDILFTDDTPPERRAPP